MSISTTLSSDVMFYDHHLLRQV